MFETKDSGKREDFSSGARRDTNEGKCRPDLITVTLKRRLGDLMARGAVKYGDNNWRLGMPTSRFLESLERHLLMYQEGDRTEDHLAAICFNAMGVMEFENTKWDGNMPELPEQLVFAFDEPEPIEEPSEYSAQRGWHNKLDWDPVNWEQMRLEVLSGKLDPNRVNWPAGYEVPTPPKG